MKGAAARGGLHLFGQAAVLAAASMLLAPACGQTITVQGTENVTVTIGATLSYTKMKGGGILVKRGNGDLDLTGVTVGNFRGRIRLKEGAVLIKQDRNLGRNENGKKQAGLIFSGGTLSFLGFSNVGSGRLITVEDKGTFDTRVNTEVNSTLVGSGLLRKTGSGYLDFSNITVNGFKGTLRIEEGSLRINEDKDLGDKSSVLEFTGGSMNVGGNVTLQAERQIKVKNTLYVYGGGGYNTTLDIASTISVAAGAELNVEGNVRISGKNNDIDDIAVLGSSALFLHTDSLGKGSKTVILGSYASVPGLVFDQKENGSIKGWEIKVDTFRGGGQLVKRSDSRLTIENGKFSGSGWFEIYIGGGAVVSKDSDTNSARVRVAGGATMEFYVDAGKRATIFSRASGDGKLLKTGEGLLEMYNDLSNGIAHFEIEEGVAEIERDGNLGAANATLSFTGGTLRFAGMSSAITVGSGRLITVEDKGTFDTRVNTEVNSTLVGSGLLRKTGSGYLDFSNITVNGFKGTLRIEEGSLRINEDKDLGDKSSVLEFTGGSMNVGGNVTLQAERQIKVKNTLYVYGGGGYNTTLDIASTISVAAGAELNVEGNVRISGKNNDIDDIAVLGSSALFLHTDSLGKGSKTVILGSYASVPGLVFDQKENGSIKGWEIKVDTFRGGGQLVKRSDSRLTIENGKFSGSGWFEIYIGGGAVVSKDSDTNSARVRVAGGATMEFYVDAGKRATIFSRASGDGKLLKTGEGLLEMYNDLSNGIAHFEIEEGVAEIERDGDLGAANATLGFMGGTLRFAGMSSAITVGSGRLITVENKGTFDTRVNARVESTLVGSGELRKIGSGYLDFRQVQAGSFEGKLRMEQGCLRLEDGVDFGKGVLIFSGGNICLAQGATALPALTLNISVASGVQVTLPIETFGISEFTTMPDSTVQIDFQGDNASLLLTIGKRSHSHNVVFNGGPNSVIEKKGDKLLLIDEGIYWDPNRSATIRIEKIGLSMRHRTSRLSLGWGVDIVARSAKLLLSLAAVTTHIGPRSLAGRGGFIKLGEGHLDMTRTDFDDFRGSFTVEDGRVDTESLSKDSRIAVDAPGMLRLSLANIVQATTTISHLGPLTLSGRGGFIKLGEGHLNMFRTDSRGFNGLLAIEGGMVDTGPLGEGSSITISDQGTMRMFLANLVRTIAVMTVPRTTRAMTKTIPVMTVTQTSKAMTLTVTIGAMTVPLTTEVIRLTKEIAAKQVVQTSAGITVTQTIPATVVTKTVPAVTVTKTIPATVVTKIVPPVKVTMFHTITIAEIAASPYTIAAMTMTSDHSSPGSLSGSGKFVKLGAGALNMFQTNGSGFTGIFDIEGGTAKIGSLGQGSKINVDADATMEGGGKVGTVAVHSGGIFYQGTSSVALHIRGDYTQKDGTYRVLLGPQFKPVTVSGQASVSGYFELVTVSDANLTTDMYTILQARDGVIGTLTSRSSIMFAQESIIVSVNGVTAMRKGLKSPVYHQYAHGRNGAGVAWALTQVETSQGRPASYALFYVQDADQARRALSSLSGQMHVSAASALMSSGGWIEDAAAGQMRLAFGKRAYASQRALRVPVAAAGLAAGTSAGGGLGVWSKSLESEKRYGGSEDVRAFSYSSSGSLLGFDLPAGAWRAGLFSGTSQAQFAQEGGEAAGSNDSYHAGMYTGRMWGKTALRAGMSYSRHEIRMSRRLSLPGAGNRLASDYKAHTFAFFGQLERLFVLAGVELEPFVGLSHIRHRTEEFVETGAAGLAIGSAEQEISASVASAGLAASGGFRLGALRMQAQGMLAWKHPLASREPAAQQSLGASDRFEVYGAGGSEDSLELEASLGVRLSEDAQMSLTYSEFDLLDAGGRDGHVRARLELVL